MEPSQQRSDLLKYYDETLISLGKNQRRFHLRSIKNFIIYFDEINESNKNETFDLIRDYLVLIKEIEYPQSTKDAAYLYNTFIYPIAKKSYFDIGFSPNLGWDGLIFIIVIVEVILLVLRCSIIFHSLVFLLIGVMKLKSFIKMKHHKLFGPMW